MRAEGSDLALIEGEFVGAIVGATGAGVEVGIDPTPVAMLFTLVRAHRNLGDGLVDSSRRRNQRKLDVNFRVQVSRSV